MKGIGVRYNIQAHIPCLTCSLAKAIFHLIPELLNSQQGRRQAHPKVPTRNTIKNNKRNLHPSYPTPDQHGDHQWMSGVADRRQLSDPLIRCGPADQPSKGRLPKYQSSSYAVSIAWWPPENSLFMKDNITLDEILQPKTTPLEPCFEAMRTCGLGVQPSSRMNGLTVITSTACPLHLSMIIPLRTSELAQGCSKHRTTLSMFDDWTCNCIACLPRVPTLLWSMQCTSARRPTYKFNSTTITITWNVGRFWELPARTTKYVCVLIEQMTVQSYNMTVFFRTQHPKPAVMRVWV